MTGSGTLADPYIIWDVNDLQNVELDLAAYYELGQDIDASATVGWNGGAGFVPITNFTGQLDGKEYTITGLTINRIGSDDQALFGRISGNAVIQNVVMTGVSVTSNGSRTAALIGRMFGTTCTVSNCSVAGSVTSTGAWQLGGLIGQMSGGTVSDCFSTCTVDGSANPTTQTGGLVGQLFANSGSLTNCYATGNVVGGNNVGGLIGERSGLGTFTVVNCYATGNISGVDYVGGLIGYEYGTTVSKCSATGNIIATDDYGGGFVGNSQGSYDQCYATGSVTVTDDYAGGFVAINWGDGTITNCYARGAVSGDDRVGGFCGDNSEIIDNCYSTGSVAGNTNVGGFCGNNSDTITNCFWDTETSGLLVSDGGTGRTTAQMKTESTFTDAGWDFTTIWDISPTLNDGYPSFPIVTTNPATSVVNNSASLNGTLDRGMANCGFEWGETIAYGKTTPTQSRTTGQTFAQTAYPLKPNTTYHFRAIATNTVGTSTGADRSFTTSQVPHYASTILPEVDTRPATLVTQHTARLNGLIIEDGGVIGDTRFQWGLSTTYGNNTPWEQGYNKGDEFFVDLNNLAEGQAFHFRAQYRNQGTIYNGRDMVFNTLSPLGPVTLVTEEIMQLLEAV